MKTVSLSISFAKFTDADFEKKAGHILASISGNLGLICEW